MTLSSCLLLSALFSAQPVLADGHDTAATDDSASADDSSSDYDDTGAESTSSGSSQGAADLAGDKGGCGFGEGSAAGLLLLLGVGATLRRPGRRR